MLDILLEMKLCWGRDQEREAVSVDLFDCMPKSSEIYLVDRTPAFLHLVLVTQPKYSFLLFYSSDP